MTNEPFTEVESEEPEVVENTTWIEKKRFSPASTHVRWLMPLFLGTGLGIGIAFVGMQLLHNPTEGSTAKPPQASLTLPTVTVAMAVTTRIARSLSSTGTVAAREHILVLPQTSGLQIKKILVNEGKQIKAGEVLAILDDSVLQTQIDQAKAKVQSDKGLFEQKQAALATARANVAQARANVAQARASEKDALVKLKNYQQLGDAGAISREQLDDRATNATTKKEALNAAVEAVNAAVATIGSASANVNSAQADVQNSAAKVAQLQTQLGQTLVRAPVAGIIAKKNVEVGDVTSTKQLFEMIRDGALELQAQVPEVQLPQVAIIVGVFLPVAFMGGIPGQFFQPFGVTVSVATIFSTFVARMVTPMMGAYLLENTYNSHTSKQTNSSSSSRRRFQPYKSLLTWALRHRFTTIIFALAFFVGSLMLVPLIPKGFVDNGDIGISTVGIELPPGSTLADTNKVVEQATDLLRQNPKVGSAVESVLATEDLDSATLTVKFKPKEERHGISQVKFEQEVRSDFQKIPGARVSFQAQGGAGSRKDLTILLKSENAEALNEGADDVERQMRAVPGLVDVTSTASLVQPEILVVPNPQQAADLGVTVQSIARTASLATIGDNDSSLAKFNLSDRQIPIRVQIDPKAKEDINTIRNLQVPSQNGSLVPLVAVADIRLGSGPAQINRYDRYRQVSIEANLHSGTSLGDAVQAVNKLPALQHLPLGVVQQPAGDAKIMGEIFARFGTALGLALMSIYAILVLLYNSFLHHLTIMMALPFCLGGALLGLMVAQKALGLYALIGMVLLMGIVTKNSILLVDYTMINLAEGKTQRQALLDAGVSRLRPILMTSIATIAGILPLALGFGAGAEVRQPMGIAIMGGFTTSTLLTVVVIPVFFSYIDDFQHWIVHFVKYRGQKRKLHVVSEDVPIPPEQENPSAKYPVSK